MAGVNEVNVMLGKLQGSADRMDNHLTTMEAGNSSR